MKTTSSPSITHQLVTFPSGELMPIFEFPNGVPTQVTVEHSIKTGNDLCLVATALKAAI
jgi:hypothetical protein